MKTAPIIESLESRNLFSATPFLAYAHAQPTPASSTHTELNAAPLLAKTPKKTPPSIVGTWTGRYTVKALPFIKSKYDLDMDISTVGKSTADGTLTIDDHDYSGRWTGYTQSAGYFSYTLKKHGDKITITGTLNAKSTYSFGTIKLDWGWLSSKGDFTLTKIS